MFQVVANCIVEYGGILFLVAPPIKDTQIRGCGLRSIHS
jgi:hypothetical protein